MLADAAHYDDGRCTASGLTAQTALDHHHVVDHGFVWLSFVDPSRDELLELQERFGLHEVAVDDILLRHDRPKFETYPGEVYFVVLRTAYYGDDARLHFGELAVFLGRDFVVTSRKGGAHAQGSARTALEARPDLLAHGVSAVLWAILAKVVRDIGPVVDALDDDLIDLEGDVFSDNDTDPTWRSSSPTVRTSRCARSRAGRPSSRCRPSSPACSG
jgi:magnesium transporter